MSEFFLRNYMLITHSFETLSAITGVFLIKKYRSTTVKYFIFFLVCIVICEFFGRYTKYVYPGRPLEFLIGTKIEKNHWWSNIYWVLGAIMFYAFYYRRILMTKSFRNILRISSYFYFVFTIIYLLLNWDEFFHQFFPVLDIFGAIIIFLCVVLYFIEILLTDKILMFYKSINFYISAVILIWWLVITPLTLYDVYFTYEIGKPYNDISYLKIRQHTFLFANIFMYSVFTFALIYCKPELNNDIKSR